MARPKAKTEEQKNAELEMMLSEAATSNHLTNSSSTRTDEGTSATLVEDSPATQQRSPAEISGNEEQKGEKASVAPSTEADTPTVPEPTPTPVPETSTPAQTSQSAPAVESTSAASTEQVVSSVASAPIVVDALADEHTAESAPEPTSPDTGNFDLASLFLPATEKKTAQMRLTDTHYQYLLLLGTIVGGGAPPPDIVHNLVQQFIDKHDAQVQKAIAKQVRLRQGKK